MATQVGESATAFTLKNTDLEEVSLADFSGRKVVLLFVPLAFSGPCTQELCDISAGINAYDDLGAQVLGISVDSPFANKAFAAKNEINFPILSDYTRNTVNAYNIAVNGFAGMDGYVAANRAVFVVDETGTVTYEWIAPTLGTEPDYAAVQAALG